MKKARLHRELFYTLSQVIPSIFIILADSLCHYCSKTSLIYDELVRPA